MIQSIFLEKGEIVLQYFCFVNLRSHILEIKENETFKSFSISRNMMLSAFSEVYNLGTR
jgi:hypothetical protein